MECSISSIRLTAFVILAIAVADTLRRFIRNRIERKGYPLPPGPTPLPLLGNVLSINSKEPWLTYTDWKAKYGDIMYIRILDTDLVVLNSRSAATELLEKRSQIYSDRPFIATVEPYGHDCDFAFSRYGEHWRLCRRIFHQTFRADAALAFRPMQLSRAQQMIFNIIEDPNGYAFHYSTFSASVAMSSVFDYDTKPWNDPMVSTMNSFVQASMPALTTERAVLFKVFPFLLRVPDWFPGSSLKREAKEATALRDRAMETSYQYVRRRMESQDHVNDTMVSDHITRMEKLDQPRRAEYEMALKHASMTAFIGSTETTSSVIMTFTLAMVENPRVWKCAQEEIDTVIGIDRLPEFDDRHSLPYVDAIVRESFRWKPVGPLGVPHANIKSDIYKGYYIPKGATVVSNIWAMSYDEDNYPNPEAFVPERFLDSRGSLIKDDPAEFIFGFGRRICPGRYAADASVWSAIATMLASLDFNPAKNENNEDITCAATYTTGLTHHPLKFPCRLTPRAHISKEVLERTLAK